MTDTMYSSTNKSSGVDTPFDPEIHLVANSISDDTPTATMESLGIEESPLTSVAYTGPFPLLTLDAVKIHRKTVFNNDVLENCKSQTWSHSIQLRGMTPTYSKFMHQFWNSDEVKTVISKAAGVELEPVMDYEICHANMQVQHSNDDLTPSSSREPKLPSQEDMIVEWHKDCYPFVVILMLSDPKGMSGGETVIRKGDGSLMFVKAPEIGQVLVFQGGRIEHAALPADGSLSERITLVTSFRPKIENAKIPNALACDISHLGNVRRYSLLSELYYQWTMSRFSNVQAAIENKKQELRKKYDEIYAQEPVNKSQGLVTKKVVDLKEMGSFIDEVVAYLNKTADEMLAVGQYGGTSKEGDCQSTFLGGHTG
ncbi:hypothetical protein UCRPC4_g02638 [Phaeomoniella chlamydospora]|uniref:Fe2OG dioxygenase domain-containing protein n=1 Tax=Phaeomoniella chlamydospora TaxID=158046 RepID=A0A0G2H518_PHACM|nr:hypothetical protein UCRPC4_g02638 [Phaeomoniella chlamydospora]